MQKSVSTLNKSGLKPLQSKIFDRVKTNDKIVFGSQNFGNDNIDKSLPNHRDGDFRNLSTKNPYKYSLIFMDCSMPILDGYAATDKIRFYLRNKK